MNISIILLNNAICFLIGIFYILIGELLNDTRRAWLIAYRLCALDQFGDILFYPLVEF